MYTTPIRESLWYYSMYIDGKECEGFFFGRIQAKDIVIQQKKR